MNKEGCNGFICAYCYLKFAASRVDVLLIPYDYLLSDELREIIGLSVENCIIIIDEAHNIFNKAEECYSKSYNIKDLQLL